MDKSAYELFSKKMAKSFEEMTAIKDLSLTALAIKTILISVFGLSFLPFLSLITQVLDPNPSFTDSNMYISNGPLLYPAVVLCANVIIGIIILAIKAKKKD